MKKPWFAFILLWLGLTLTSTAALAVTYTFSGTVGGATYPNCAGWGEWTQSGTTYTCPTSFSLASGDSILPSSSITVVASAGISLAGKNTIGSSTAAVNLQTAWGDITASNSGGKTSTIYGDLTSSSGSFYLTNVIVQGRLSTDDEIRLIGGSVSGDVNGYNGVTTDGTVITGSVTANGGRIDLSRGSVAGSVHSDCCSITTYYTDITGGVSAVISSSSNTIWITGGTVSGAISTSGGAGIIIEDATVAAGSITATGVKIVIRNSQIGSKLSPVNVSGNNWDFIFDRTTIYGNVTAGSWPNALQMDNSSHVYGSCTPKPSPDLGQCIPYSFGPDHIRVFFNNNTTALTCTPRTLDAIACADSMCSSRYASATSVTLSPGGTATTIAASGIGTPSVAQTAEGMATIALAASSPAAGGLLCYSGSVASPGSAVTCSLTFSKAGFFVSVADHASCTTQTLTITAAKADDKTKTCVPAFDNGASRNIKLRFSYANPTSGASTAVFPTVGSASPPTSALATASDSTLAMTFTSGVATTNFRYNDAGSLNVSASYTGSAANSDAGLSMDTVAGSAFVVAPASFAISGIPAAPLTAGSSFDITVTAKNSCGNTTANYGRETTTATALLTSSNPLPALGNATPISQTLSGFSSGAASTKLTWNEVGTVDITATTTKYLDSALNVVGTQAAVGRFKPAYFDTIVSHGCSDLFTYAGLVTPSIAGQPFTVEVKAKRFDGNLTDGTNTANYSGATWGKVVTLSDANDANGDKGKLANNIFAATDFVSGKAKRTDVNYAMATKLTAPYTLAIRAVDTDSVSSSGHSEGSTPTRSGRLRLISGQGSEQAPFVVKSAAQFWDGTYWQANTLDSCTSYSTANAKVAGSTGTAVSAATGIKSGYGTLTLSKPTVAGAATVCLDTGTLASDGCVAALPGSIGYLRGNWKVVTSYDQDPSATVQFGGANANSRGNWGFLYRRENF